MDKYIKIKFQDNEYLMKTTFFGYIICEISEDGDPIEMDKDGTCFAIIENGKIMRFQKEIGRMEDIIQIVE